MSGLSLGSIGAWFVDHWGLLYKSSAKLLFGKVMLDLEEEIREAKAEINVLRRHPRINVIGDHNVVVNNNFNEDEKLYYSHVSAGANTIVMSASVPMEIETSATLDAGLEGSISGKASLGPLPSDDAETKEDN